MTPVPLRGEVWLVSLDPVRGHEQAGSRTCLVVSDDLYNRGRSGKHIVLPITSRFKGIPYHIEVTPPDGGFRTKSYVMCDDVRKCFSRSPVEAARLCFSANPVGNRG